MTSILFGNKNHGSQIAANYGSINYFSPVSTDRLLDDDFWRHLSVTVPLEDRKDLKRKKGDPTPGTCQWVLRTKELTTWLGSGLTVGPESQLAQVLWLYGNPGTGKSMMAIYLTEELENRNTLAYFFCDSGVDTRRTATSIVKGLLYQLVKQYEKLLAYILPKYHERGIKLFTSFDSLWGIFMAMVADEETGQKYCIIDALDECDRESQNILLLQLEETFLSQTVSSNLRILVTSRPYPEIREILQRFPNKDLASFAQREKDMDLFIKQKVKALTNKNYTKKVKLQVCRILQEKAEGTFLWIGLACEEIKDRLSNCVVRALQNLPKGLNALYTALLEAALTHNETSGDDIRRLLSCVVVILRPLTVSELSEACQLYQEEEDAETRIQFTRDLIESCRLLIIIQDERVLLLHQSVKDYLVGAGSNNFIDVSKAHARMAHRLVDYLTEQLRNTNKQKSIKRNDTLMNYSATYWISHTINETTPEPKLLRLAANLCEAERASAWTRFVEPPFWYTHDVNEPLPFFWAARWGLIEVADLMLRESQIQITDEILEKAAAHVSGKDTVMRLLLDRRGKEIRITDKILQKSAANWTGGYSIMKLLLDRRGNEIKITAKVMQTAVANSQSGLEIVELLLGRKKKDIKVTAKVLSIAAERFSGGLEMIRLLLPRRVKGITPRIARAIWGKSLSEKEAIRQLLSPYLMRFQQRFRHDQRRPTRSPGLRYRQKKAYRLAVRMTR